MSYSIALSVRATEFVYFAQATVALKLHFCFVLDENAVTMLPKLSAQSMSDVSTVVGLFCQKFRNCSICSFVQNHVMFLVHSSLILELTFKQ